MNKPRTSAMLCWSLTLMVALSAGMYGKAEAAQALLGWGKQLGKQTPAPWVAQFHPKIAKHTRFELIQRNASEDSWLQLSAEESYGSWTLDWSKQPQVIDSLSWQWQVMEHPKGLNLRSKAGDDAAVKLCLFVAVDESKLSLGQRLSLAAARTVSGQDLPAATLCYVFADPNNPTGPVFNNPYTERVRNLVVRSAPAGDEVWTERRPVQADARAAFGAELPDGPVRLLGLAVGADADNTQSKSVAYFRWKSP